MSSENFVSNILDGAKKLNLLKNLNCEPSLNFRYTVNDENQHILMLNDIPESDYDYENLESDLVSSAFILSKQFLFTSQIGLLTYLTHKPNTHQLLFKPRTSISIYDVELNSLERGSTKNKIFRNALKTSLDQDLEKYQIRTFQVNPRKFLFIGKEENPLAWDQFHKTHSKYFTLQEKKIEPFSLDEMFYKRTN